MRACSISLAVVLAVPLLSAAGCQPRAKGPVWLEAGRRCARAESELHAGRLELSPAVAEHERCRKALSSLPPPPVGEIEAALRSDSSVDRLAGLFVMSEKRMTDDGLVALVLSRYSPADSLLVRLHSLEALGWVRGEQVTRYSAELTRVLGSERSAPVVLAAAGLLSQLDEAAVVDMATGWIKTPDFELQFAAFEIARRVGLVAKLRGKLAEGRADEALATLDRLERMKSSAADDRDRR